MEAIDRLNEETDKTVSVTVWNGNEQLIIKWLDSSTRKNLPCPPTGETAQGIGGPVLQELQVTPETLGRPITREELQPHLEIIKRDNYCAFFSDYLPEIDVLSRPAFDINGSIVTVITLLGLDRDTDISKGSLLFEQVRGCSDRVTRQIFGQQREDNGRD